MARAGVWWGVYQADKADPPYPWGAGTGQRGTLNLVKSLQHRIIHRFFTKIISSEKQDSPKYPLLPCPNVLQNNPCPSPYPPPIIIPIHCSPVSVFENRVVNFGRLSALVIQTIQDLIHCGYLLLMGHEPYRQDRPIL